jgi:hypothetical protein
MKSRSKVLRYFRPLFIILILITMGCQPAFPEAEPAWITFTNQEYGYEFRYPSEARVEVTLKDASQVKVHIETDHPFQMTVKADYSPSDVFYYLDTEASGQRTIGKNVWFEFILPDGYCDAIGCSEPIYALQLEWGDVLYTATFQSQETTTELQEEILATFRISGKP